MTGIDVMVRATDRLTHEGAVAKLSAYAQLNLVRPGSAGSGTLLLLAGQVDDRLLSSMRTWHKTAGGGELSIVLVADGMREHQILRAVNFGLVSLLPRHETSFDAIVDAIVAVGTGHARLPEIILRCLLDQIRGLHQHVSTLPATTNAALTTREIDVLRLLSDGLDTNEIGMKLNYSDRTVKNIVHGITSRLRLRNRTHAVAYALRAGLL